MDLSSSTTPFVPIARQVGPDTRVQDWLDDKLQTEADIENVNVLLENVRQQQELLRAQVGLPLRLRTSALSSADRDAIVRRGGTRPEYIPGVV